MAGNKSKGRKQTMQSNHELRTHTGRRAGHRPWCGVLIALGLLALPAAVMAQSDATLTNLVPSAGTLNPAFDSGTFSYTASVPYATNSMTVTPTTTDPNATNTVNGSFVAYSSPSAPISLSEGANVITTEVVSADTTATNIYLLTVTRAAAITADATLTNLVPSTGTLSPAFASGTFSYTESVPYATTSLTVTPYAAADTNATITVNGTNVVSGAASGSINLNEGANVITTVVVSQDASATNTYTLTVTRAGSAPRNLYSSGAKTWDTTTANWGTGSGGPYNTATWNNATPDSAVFQGTAGTVTLGEAISISNLALTVANYNIIGNTLNFVAGGAISNTLAAAQTIRSAISGSPKVYIYDNPSAAITFAPTNGSQSLGTCTVPYDAGSSDKAYIYLDGTTTGNSASKITYQSSPDNHGAACTSRTPARGPWGMWTLEP